MDELPNVDWGFKEARKRNARIKAWFRKVRVLEAEAQAHIHVKNLLSKKETVK